MSSKPAQPVVGKGEPELDLAPEELRAIAVQALSCIARGERVLAIIPDRTRDDGTDLLFPFAAEILCERVVAEFDALVAQGTHAPMSDAEKRAKVGLQDGASPHSSVNIYDHHWDDAEELVTLGELSAARVRELTGGLLDQPIKVNLNRLLAPGRYDTVVVFGATVPHEVAGFA